MRLARMTALAALALAVGASVAWAQGPVVLQFKLSEGDVHKYKATFDGTIQMSGSMMPQSVSSPFNMEMAYSQEVIELTPEGNFRVRITYDGMSVQMMGQSMTMPTSDLPSTELVMTRQGAIVSLKLSGGQTSAMGFSEFDQIIGGAAEGCTVFPEYAVSVGDTWEMDFSKMMKGLPFQVGGATAQSTLAGLGKLRGFPCAKVVTRMSVPIEISAADLGLPAGEGQMSMQLDFYAVIYHRLSDGVPLKQMGQIRLSAAVSAGQADKFSFSLAGKFEASEESYTSAPALGR